MSKHTPGPWHIESEPFNVWDANGLLIARAHSQLEQDDDWERGCANARLIAAAPDLLAVVKDAVECQRLQQPCDRYPWFNDALAAIAKAECSP